jgi:hypothetical protein
MAAARQSGSAARALHADPNVVLRENTDVNSLRSLTARTLLVLASFVASLAVLAFAAANSGSSAVTGSAADVKCESNDVTWSHGEPFTLKLDFSGAPDQFKSFHDAKLRYQYEAPGKTKVHQALWNMTKAVKDADKKRITVVLQAQCPHATVSTAGVSHNLSFHSDGTGKGPIVLSVVRKVELHNAKLSTTEAVSILETVDVDLKSKEIDER